jgi:ABC-2 type transport system permease protein
MNTLAYAVSDSTTMLRRNLRRMQRYPSLTLMLVGIPVIFLLLFVYVFGGTLGAGIGSASGGRAEYVNYVTPGILLMAVAGVAQGTAISVAMDMTEGIIARFRTMAIFRPSVLTGHVLGSMIGPGSAWRLSSESPCSSGSDPPPVPPSGPQP